MSLNHIFHTRMSFKQSAGSFLSVTTGGENHYSFILTTLYTTFWETSITQSTSIKQPAGSFLRVTPAGGNQGCLSILPRTLSVKNTHPYTITQGPHATDS